MKNAFYLLQSADEFIPNDRRDAYGNVIAFDKHKIAEDALKFHSDLLHNAKTLFIPDDIVRLDAVQAEISESEPQNRAQRLGSDLLTPSGAVENVSDLGGVRGEIERRKSARADHFPRRLLDYRPVVVIAAFVARKSVREKLERVALVFIVRPRQVLCDLGIAGVFVQVRPVALFKFAERQPSRL